MRTCTGRDTGSKSAFRIGLYDSSIAKLHVCDQYNGIGGNGPLACGNKGVSGCSVMVNGYCS
jgi:hypothetical protein